MSEFTREPSVIVEEVERRLEARGPVRDLVASLPGEPRLAVLEAGRRGVFVAHDDPDRYPLGARLDLTLVGRGRTVAARAEVVRKDLQPRRGLALLIVHMAPDAAADYVAMLGA